MNTLKDLAFMVVFCGIIVVCMMSTVVIYNNIPQAANMLTSGGASTFTGNNFSTNDQQLMFLLRAKMV